MSTKKNITKSSPAEKEQKKKLPPLGAMGAYCILLLGWMLFIAIYTATQFPYSFITLEGNDFWMLTRDYWQLKLAMTPALTNWIAEYLIQFYRSPFVAAGIQALIQGAIGLLAYAVLKHLTRNRWHLGWLGLLPPILLGLYCTFNLPFQLQCLALFAFLYAFIQIPGYKGKMLMSILSVPVGFLLMKTPMLAVMIVLYALLSLKFLLLIPCALLLFLTPLVYSQQVAFIPFEKRYTDWGCQTNSLKSKGVKDSETLKKIICLANEGRWEDLLYHEHLRSLGQRGNPILMRYALLAESALGTLPENLLDYPIQEENQFYYQHEQKTIPQQFNKLFYLNLGIYDEAFHQAEEYGLLMPNGNCFSSLRQMADCSIEEGDWEIADKYLLILSKSSCHKDFVRERRDRMQKLKSAASKDIPLRADNFVGGYPLPIEMLRLARYYEHSPHRKKMVDYALCSYILRGDVNSFNIAIQAFDFYKDKELPRAYREFQEHFGQ